MNDGRANALGVRYYGELAEGRSDMIVDAVLVGLFTPILEVGITPVGQERRLRSGHRVIDRAATGHAPPASFQ